MLDKKLKFLLFAVIVGITFSCSSDEEPDDMMDMMDMMDDCANENVSYMDDIVPILNTTCALSGCHVDGFSSGNFTMYQPLKDRVDNGRLKARVVDQMNMPPSNSSGPTSLSNEDILAFQCWIEAGGPNN